MHKNDCALMILFAMLCGCDETAKRTNKKKRIYERKKEVCRNYVTLTLSFLLDAGVSDLKCHESCFGPSVSLTLLTLRKDHVLYHMNYV